MAEPVLSIRDLQVEFETTDGIVHAVDHVSYDVLPGEMLGVVGESGSGKSVTVLAALGLIQQPPGRIAGGEVIFQGRNIVGLSDKEMRSIRNKEIAMVFQDPMTSLNPVFKVGWQIAEALLTHNDDMSDEEARSRTVELLDLVGVPDAEHRYDQYPHEYSGGMRQRAMIAMAIANQPAVLIADEPTTALDVTIQLQYLKLLKELQSETQMALLFITHDFGIVARMCDRVAVMYAGRIVEQGPVRQVFRQPSHPYTEALIASVPRMDMKVDQLTAIDGQPPPLDKLPPGCRFADRCAYTEPRCTTRYPSMSTVGTDHTAACWRLEVS